MADQFSPDKRSAIMRAVRGKDTSPELVVRRLTHRLGYRFRLHCGDLPGRPDMVFRSRKKVVFVHGCYWHKHGCKRGDRLPASNRAYWFAKLERNRLRDRRHREQLRRLGYRSLVIWECQMRAPDRLANRLRKFLED